MTNETQTTEPKWERGARAYCQVSGIDPDEMVQYADGPHANRTRPKWMDIATMLMQSKLHKSAMQAAQEAMA